MTSLLRAVVVCLAALALVVASGCGGTSSSDKNDYVSAINKVQTDFANNIQKVGQTPSGSDPTAAAKKTFANLKAAIDKAVADLKNVKPPSEVKDLHNELISEMNDFNSQVKAAGDSLNSGDPQSIVQAQTKFATSASSLGSRISRTIDNINKKLQS